MQMYVYIYIFIYLCAHVHTDILCTYTYTYMNQFGGILQSSHPGLFRPCKRFACSSWRMLPSSKPAHARILWVIRGTVETPFHPSPKRRTICPCNITRSRRAWRNCVERDKAHSGGPLTPMLQRLLTMARCRAVRRLSAVGHLFGQRLLKHCGLHTAVLACTFYGIVAVWWDANERKPRLPRSQPCWLVAPQIPEAQARQPQVGF